MCNVADFYNKMYYESEEDFTRKEFYHDTDPVHHENDAFTVEGTMDATHQPTITIQIREN